MNIFIGCIKNTKLYSGVDIISHTSLGFLSFHPTDLYWKNFVMYVGLFQHTLGWFCIPLNTVPKAKKIDYMFLRHVFSEKMWEGIFYFLLFIYRK